MAERRWTFVVQDARGRRHRGAVTWSSRLESRVTPPAPPDTFRIVLLAQPSSVREAPTRTAVCVPGVPRLRAIRAGDEVVLPRRIADLTLPPHKMMEYATGTIVTAAEGIIAPDDVFPAHSDHPRLDRLALALIEASAAEAVAPFTALIRHELGLRPGADALAELGERLAPPDAKERPPARAPGVLRLARALRRLRDGSAPADSLEQLGQDLRFLRLFGAEDSRISGEALDKLLGDMIDPPSGEKHTPAKIVPLRPKRDRE
jgi:hypothetical protein